MAQPFGRRLANVGWTKFCWLGIDVWRFSDILLCRRLGGIMRWSASVVRPFVCLMSRTSALTRKPKGIGRRNFEQGYPRSHATTTPTSRSKGQKSRSRGQLVQRSEMCPRTTNCTVHCISPKPITVGLSAVCLPTFNHSIVRHFSQALKTLGYWDCFRLSSVCHLSLQWSCT